MEKIPIEFKIEDDFPFKIETKLKFFCFCLICLWQSIYTRKSHF